MIVFLSNCRRGAASTSGSSSEELSSGKSIVGWSKRTSALSAPCGSGGAASVPGPLLIGEAACGGTSAAGTAGARLLLVGGSRPFNSGSPEALVFALVVRGIANSRSNNRFSILFKQLGHVFELPCA